MGERKLPVAHFLLYTNRGKPLSCPRNSHNNSPSGRFLIAGRTAVYLQIKRYFLSQFFMYLVPLPLPIFRMEPLLTICPKTASIVVALTSGSIFPISAFALE